MENNKGKLYLIPNTLGATSPEMVVAPLVIKVIESLNHFVVENEKQARKYIKAVCPSKNQSQLQIETINKYTETSAIPNYLMPCFNGYSIGVISDAGCPGVADPGAQIVAEAHLQGITVIPLVGPSSLLLGLMGSGLNGQNFAFHGYLPIDKNERKLVIKKLEKQSIENNQTQLFIETPYRNNALLSQLLEVLNPQTFVCIACDLTLTSEYILTKTVAQWKKIKVDLHKRPTLFIFQKIDNF